MSSTRKFNNRLGLALLAGAAVLGGGSAQAQVAGYQAYREDPGSALNRHLRALSDDPRSLSALIGAGQAALQLGDPQASATFFARAEELAPRDPRIKAGIGSAFVQMEQAQAALRFFSEASSLGIHEGQIAGDRGLAYDLLGNPIQAQRDYKLALRTKPDPEIERRLALSLAISGDKAGAIAAIDGQLRRQDRAAWRTRAFVLALTGDAAGATQAVQQVLPGQAAAMQPFLARLPTLDLAGRAMAVHFGHFPGDGRPMQSAQATQYASLAPSTNVQAGRPDTAQTALGALRPAQPASISTEPRRRPGVAEAATIREAASRPTPRPGPAASTPSRRSDSSLPLSMRLAERRQQSQPPPRAEQKPPQVTAATSAPRLAVPAPAQPVPQPVDSKPAAMTPRETASLQNPPSISPSATSSPAPAATAAMPAPLTNSPPPALATTAPVREVFGPPAGTSVPQPAQPQPAPQQQSVPSAPPSTNVQTVALPEPRPAAPQPEPAAAPIREAAVAENKPAAAPPAASPPAAGPIREAAVAENKPTAAPPVAAPPAAAPARRTLAFADVVDAIKSLPDTTTAEKKPVRIASAAPTPLREAVPKAEPAAAASTGNASRHWVQIASAPDSLVESEYRRLKRKHPGLLSDKEGYRAPMGKSNRVLVGPFASASEASAFVGQLKKSSLTAIAWTSADGQEIDKLP